MKLKRFLTGVLSAVMALSVCALPAAAAEGETTVNDPTDPKLTASTIDKTQVGSITIHKYGQLKEGSNAENGTGEADATVATNPENKPLEGVDFTLYRVKTTADLLKYYDALEGASVEEFTAGDCFTATDESKWSATTLKDTYTSDATGNDTTATVGKVRTAKTNAEGAAQFDNLPVGMYLVIETNKVQSVTKTVTPFLVSIPMTRIGDTKSETTGDNNLKQWLYDVVVYPKNSTAQGTVTLVKQGKHGDATPEKLGGVMFKLFQYQDSKADYVDITDNLQNITPVDGKSYVVTSSGNDLGTIKFENLPMGKYYVQEYGYTTNNDKGYIINTKGKYGFKIDDQGQVAVQAETGTGETDWVTKDDGFSAGNGTITITNYKPEFEKTVEPRTGTTSTDKHQADYGIGDKVPYTLTIKVPENVAKLHTFKVVDTTLKDQLEHIPEDFKLTATDKDSGAQTLTEKDAYTKEITVGKDAEKKDTSILTVNFTPAKLASVAGGTITIRYYATLGAGAVVADNGNLNTAKLLYSRKTDTDDSSETDNSKKPYEITDEGVVYTFMTSIEKKGKGGSYNDQLMPGVTFALYRKVEDAEWNKDSKVTIAGQEYTKEGAVPGATAVKLGLAANESETWVQIYHDGELEAVTNDKGIVEYKGLPSGTYKFIETKTLDKYNLLTSPVDAKLSLSYTTKWKDTSKYDANGNLTNHKSETVEYKNGDAVVPDPNAVIKVVNRSGFTLPVTGGFGTLLFSGIGVLLVLAGVAVLFSMKKKNDRT